MGHDDLRALLGEKKGDATGGSDSDKPLIFVVDDEPDILDSLKILLVGRSYRVLAFESGAGALDALTDDVAAVILDVKMQGHDGFWTCDAIRMKNPYLPVIFYSAYQDLKDPYKIINEHRPFGYLPKDGDVSALLNMIGRAVQYSRTFVEIERLVGRLHAVESMLDPKPDEP
jgi:DNA-binding NtrC family response regulator